MTFSKIYGGYLTDNTETGTEVLKTTSDDLGYLPETFEYFATRFEGDHDSEVSVGADGTVCVNRDTVSVYVSAGGLVQVALRNGVTLVIDTVTFTVIRHVA